ncbi:hypothetical protein DPMN_126095 [Dreissena polymorpha]|uniref:Uncharacterized protein n=1 Tax=Dreissena polymorpha TaxID=45954 RepID=A0A9D4GWN8_DREPO|nr:hypothetical protein DPMN_126095 [Dreissena polymorpha]
MGTSLIFTRVSNYERQRDELHDKVTYLKSQTMRNNRIFTNITEDNATGSEPAEVLERKLRVHMKSALKLSRFMRVHRSPGHPIPVKTRNIVAMFKFCQDRE